MSELHVILGAGQVGSAIASELLAQGKRVRQVRRGPPGGDRRIEWRSGDLTDPAFAEEAMRGASVAYDCINPPYDRWPELLPGQRRGVLHGAMRNGVKLVQLDNLYMYGAPDAPMTEETAAAPQSRKGELRARLAEETLAASRRGDLRVAVARASDFYGPGFVRATIFGDRFFQRVLSGRPAQVLGDADMPHSYSYGPDVARAMIRLGEAGDDVLGQVWHLPVRPAEGTRAMMERFAAALGVAVHLQRVPDWLLRAMGIFQPVLREVAEMTYQWKKPFVLDDAKWRRRFGDEPTPVEQGVAFTARWALEAFGRARAA